MSSGARVSLIILTYNRPEELARAVAAGASLPERPPIMVVDNASSEDPAGWLAERHPRVRLLRLPRNVGASARNAGVEAATTPYVAFADDDTEWAPGSLARAVGLLDAHPRLAAVNARVLIGEDRRLDPVSALMSVSPLPSEGLPGRALLGFLAGATVFRREAFLAAGGYEPRFFLGGEEALLTLDLVAAGWSLAYCPELIVHHYPSPSRDREERRRLLARNALWVAWLRRPARSALRQTLRLVRASLADGPSFAGCLEALGGLAWAMRRRRVVPPHVEALCARLE